MVLAVVDPGVGTGRRAVAVEVGEDGESVLVGPDNGLLAGAVSMVGGATRAVSLTNDAYHLPAPPGATFAGRDVFAAVAAHLCNGVELPDLGEPLDPMTLVPGLLPVCREEDGALVAEALWVDRFGNVQLNVSPEDVEGFGERVTVRSGEQVRTARQATVYGELQPGEVGLVVDSYGLLSLAMREESASDTLRIGPGAAITLSSPGDPVV